MTEDEKPAEQPYVDDSPDEAPAPDVPQADEETPKTDAVPEDAPAEEVKEPE